jgi:hypothetical protein
MRKIVRIAVYPADVCKITGKSMSYSRKVLTRLKKLHRKQSHQVITFDEVRDYLGLTQSQVNQYLSND